MAKSNLIIRIFLVLACMALTAGVVFLLITVENEKGKIQKDVQKLAASKKGLASVVTYLEESNVALKKKLKASEMKLAELTSQYNEEKDKNEASNQKVEEKEAEIQHIEANIAKYTKEKKKMIQRLELLNAAFNEIKAEYDEIADAKEASDKEAEELGRIVKDLSRDTSTALGTVVIR